MELQPIVLAVIFVLGLLIGSFLNVCIYRIPIGQTIVKGRSYCPCCQSLIKWYQNIPLISYIFLKGRCSNCGCAISIRYPAVETLTGLLFLAAYIAYGYSLESIFAAILFSLLATISFIDIDTRTIPDGLVIFILALGIVRGGYLYIYHSVPWYFFLIGFFAASLFLLILSFLFTDSMGGGDIKLMAAAGLYLGGKLILFSLFIGAFYGAIYAVFLFARRKAGMKTQVPFGPFLSLGIITALLFGERLWAFYLSILS